MICHHCKREAGPGNGICDDCLEIETEADGIRCPFHKDTPVAYCHRCEMLLYACVTCERVHCYECGTRLDWWCDRRGHFYYGRDECLDRPTVWERLGTLDIGDPIDTGPDAHH